MTWPEISTLTEANYDEMAVLESNFQVRSIECYAQISRGFALRFGST